MLKDLLKGRFLGHPIHPMLVHFPTAFFPLSLFFNLLGIISHDASLFMASFYSMSLGFLGGLLAGIFGMIDYVKLTERPVLFRKASWHAGLQICVLMTFGVLTGIRLMDYPELTEPGLFHIIVEAIAVGTMLAANYLGGDLVFRYGIGVRGQ